MAASSLPEAEFEQRYASAFLLTWLRSIDDVPRVEFERDFDGDITKEIFAEVLDTDDLSMDRVRRAASEAVIVAMPLRRRRSSQVSFVSVGRTPNNDVQFLDPSISRFHAYLRESQGRWTVQDAGSANGTEVNYRVVCEHGAGPPTPLHSRDSIVFGAMRGIFLSARDFQNDLQALVTRGLLHNEEQEKLYLAH